MKRSLQHAHTRVFLLIGSFLLLLFLSACTTGNSTTTIAKTKLIATPTPGLSTYQGNGYTIGYPQGWSVKGKGSLVTFTGAQGLTTFIIEEISNPNGIIPPATAIDGGLNGFKEQGANFQKIAVTPTFTLSGNTWNQGEAVANTAATSLKLVVLSRDYPQRRASTHTFTLIYSTPTKEFDQVNTQSFQPMLQSFKFV